MRKLSIAVLLAFLLAGCSPGVHTSQPGPQETPTLLVPSPTATAEPTATPLPPTSTPDYIDSICSPLQDVSLDELPSIITQPLIAPNIGKDDGHHGVDFSFYRFKDYVGIEGLPVLSAMEGEVVTILNDRLPYGNAIIIETPLEKVDPELLSLLAIPEVQPTVEPAPNVNCPANGELSFKLSDSERSIYILYAHLKDLPSLQVGDHVDCGQAIGAVGNTGKGYSTNPHLHFETRVGPSGAKFESMAYYTVNSSEAERYNYCVWRVSNLFQLFDPMILLSYQK